jgi:hypothetical protein
VRIYCKAVLPRAGLGNRLFPFEHEQVSRVATGSVIGDLLALARAKILIASGGPPDRVIALIANPSALTRRAPRRYVLGRVLGWAAGPRPRR